MSDIQSSPSPSCPGVGINGTLVADLPQSLGQAWERTAESDACGHGDVKILEPLFEGHLAKYCACASVTRTLANPPESELLQRTWLIGRTSSLHRLPPISGEPTPA